MATQPASGNQVAGGRESASDDWDASGKTAPGMENLIGDGNQEAAEEVTEEAEAEPAQEEAAAEGAEEAPAEEAVEEGQETEPRRFGYTS